MKRPLKSNQRRKQLNRQHHKMISRRQSHFNQAITELHESPVSNQAN
ncbi:hypothetical protein [Colwellia sp. Bg11-28]|nr:hypothetical protein [Colwellia sp. Bg11-28]